MTYKAKPGEFPYPITDHFCLPFGAHLPDGNGFYSGDCMWTSLTWSGEYYEREILYVLEFYRIDQMAYWDYWGPFNVHIEDANARPIREAPTDGTTPGAGARAGDPVDLSTGIFTYAQTDLILPDILPITVGRSYQAKDTRGLAFGTGTADPLDLRLAWANPTASGSDLDLVTPEGGRIRFARNAGQYLHTTTPTQFYKAYITPLPQGQGWEMTLINGSVYVFGAEFGLLAVRDRFGNQITVRRANGPYGRITHLRSPNGHWLAYSYDAEGRVQQVQDNGGRTVTYTYDANNHLWKVTNPLGYVTEYRYQDNRLTEIWDTRTPSVRMLLNEYDPDGRVQKQTQADGSIYQFSYTVNPATQQVTQTEVTNPRGTVTRTTFNANGYPLSETVGVDPPGPGEPTAQTVTSTRYAGTNLVETVTDDLGRQTRYTYDVWGNVKTVTTMNGTAAAATTTIKDPLASANPALPASTADYNAAGQPTRVTTALNKTTQTDYANGEPVSVTDPLGRTTTAFRDSLGRLVIAVSPLGQISRTQYDALNRVTQVTNPLGHSTTYAYDPNGNLLSLTDALGHTTSWTYDAMNRAETQTAPPAAPDQNRVSSAAYDPQGRWVRASDRNGNTTVSCFDRLGRLASTGYGTTGPDCGTSFSGGTITWSYDGANRLTQALDSVNGTITRSYNDLARTASETTPQGTISYAFDAAGRRTSLAIAGQPAVTYCYDAAHRLTQLRQNVAADCSSPTTATVRLEYDDAGRRSSLTLPNGVRSVYGYDDASQLATLTYEQGTTTIGDLSYSYDKVGRRSQMAGSKARLGIPLVVSSISYNESNQLTQWGSATYSYDPNGNLLSNGLTWDARNQLISGYGATEYRYDAFGRRTSKTIGDTTTQFLYDGAQAVQEQSASGTPTANYLAGPRLDEVFARTDSNGRRSLLVDALGSTLDELDDAGVSQMNYTYQAFGKTSPYPGLSSSSPLQYTGRERDGGLYYYRGRYYEPILQRFISPDPLGFGGGDPNLYAYVGNSPTNATAPTGLIVDTLLNLGFIAYDLHELVTGSPKDHTQHLIALGLDAAGALLPFATGLGAAYRLARVGAKGAQVAEQANHLRRSAEAVEHEASLLGRAAQCAASFDPATPVATERGERPIKDLRVGERVLAYDEATARTTSAPITAVLVHADPVLVRLLLDGELITRARCASARCS